MCMAVVAWRECTDLNGFYMACEADNTNCGVYKYDDDTCSNSAAPSYVADANCSTMNGYKT